MKSFAFCLKWLIGFAASVLMLAGCSTFTYETQSWRVAETSENSADVIVRYVGVGTSSKDVNDRVEKAKEIIELAADKNPDDPITPRLRNAHRKVFIQDDKVIIEETGTIPNPLSWFEQTGLNIFTWFNDPIDLAIVNRYIVKSGWDEDEVLLATNGRVIDEDIFSSSILRLNTPLAIGGDTVWQRSEPRDIVDLAEPERRQLIIWPRASRLFYWKFTGPAFNSSKTSDDGKTVIYNWQSLAPEVSALINSMKEPQATNKTDKAKAAGAPKTAKKEQKPAEEKK